MGRPSTSGECQPDHPVRRAEEGVGTDRESIRLQQLTSFHRSLLDNLPVGVFRSTPDGRVVTVSASLVRMLGFESEAAMTTRPAVDFYPDPEMRAELARRLEADGQVLDYETELQRRDGSRFWCSFNIRRVVDPGTGQVFLDGVVEDVSGRRQALEQLRSSEARYRFLYDGSQAITLIVSRERVILDVNKWLIERLGYTREQVVGRDILDFVVPGQREAAGEMFQETFGQPNQRSFEVEVVDGGGRIRSLLFSPGQAPLIENGRVAGIIITGMDVTDERRAQVGLQQSLARMQTLMDNLPGSAFVKDRMGRYTAVNRSFAGMFGRTPEELVGLTDPQLYYPEAVERIRAEDAQVMEKGRPLSIERESRRVAPGHHFLIRKVPLNGPSGEIVGLVGVMFDISQQKQTEAALAAEKERLAVTLRSIGDGVIATDTDGRVRLVNRVAEQLTGWSQEEAADRPLADLFCLANEQDGTPLPDPVGRVVGAGGPVTITAAAVLAMRDGTRRVVAASGAPIHDRKGGSLGAVVVFWDITEKRLIEAEALRAQKLESIGVLAGGIAHDFNNILTAILGNLTLSRSALPPGTPAAERLAEAERAAYRARELTAQLLTFSRGGAPVKKRGSLSDRIRETADFALRGSKVRCHFELASDLWTAEFDEGQIGQVIHNMTINAEQAMPDGGTMRIAGRNVAVEPGSDPLLAPGRYVLIEVEDRGIGMPAALIPKIFDPYFTTKQKGSGLGLAICHSVVRNHGGTIRVRSKPGQGTTFSVWLPALGETPGPLPDEPAAPSPAVGGRVLVMDDDPMIRAVAAELLVVTGYAVETASDGPEAVERYRDGMAAGRPFDTVILDLTVPGGIGGLETVRRLREIDPGVTALVSSGYSNDPVMADCRAHGFFGVVAKPYRLEDLALAVGAAVAARRRPTDGAGDG